MTLVKIKISGSTNAFNEVRPNSLIHLGLCDDMVHSTLLLKDDKYARIDAVVYFDSVEFGDTVEVPLFEGA